MSDPSDPTVTLEQKLNAFAGTLSDDELTVLHDVMHLAREGSEVQGFAMPKSALHSADPCEGGQVTFPNTFTMLGNLHFSLHRGAAPAGPAGAPTPFPNQA
jgi:hypothetical protein